MNIQQANIAVIFGTDTGNTEEVADKIIKLLNSQGHAIEKYNIADADLEEFMTYDLIIFGIPTWDFGGIQEDWEELEDELSLLNLKQTKIAIYGLGDQFGYGDYFIDAVGWLYEKLIPTQAKIIGKWPSIGYSFEESRACINNNKTEFCGLAIDEDQQFEQSDKRIEKWVIQIINEFESL